MSKDIEMNMIDAILDKPFGFTFKRKQYYIYPTTIGKKMITARLLETIKSHKKITNIKELFYIADLYKDVYLRLIAIHTLKTKDEVLDNKIVDRRIRKFRKMNNNDIATLVMFILQEDNPEDYINHIGLNIDRDKKNKIARVKKDNKNRYTFGGKSIYGTLIDMACEKYGWSFDYIVWGISYINLFMLLEDSISEIYLTDEERKQVKISNDTDIINADDPKNKEKILAMFK